MDIFHRKFHNGKFANKPEQTAPDSNNTTENAPNTSSTLGGPRKADVLAGPGSLADKLRKRRKAIEEGDPTGGKDSEY